MNPELGVLGVKNPDFFNFAAGRIVYRCAPVHRRLAEDVGDTIAIQEVIVANMEGLLTALEQGPDREPLPLARFAGEQLDPRRTLLVSPFRLDGRWQKGNGPRRDKLVVALAQRVVAVEVKAGGTIDGLCRDATRLGRRVFACQFAEQPRAACANPTRSPWPRCPNQTL